MTTGLRYDADMSDTGSKLRAMDGAGHSRERLRQVLVWDSYFSCPETEGAS